MNTVAVDKVLIGPVYLLNEDVKFPQQMKDIVESGKVGFVKVRMLWSDGETTVRDQPFRDGKFTNASIPKDIRTILEAQYGDGIQYAHPQN